MAFEIKFMSYILNICEHSIIQVCGTISRAFHCYYYFSILRVFFTPALTDGFSLDSEWEQVSSSLQDSFRYSGRSQQRCSLDGVLSFSYIWILQSLYRMPQSHMVLTPHLCFSSLARSSYLSLILFCCPPVQPSPLFDYWIKSILQHYQDEPE